MDDLRVSAELVIPAAEIEARFSRSGGPGGQHVNTSSTRVELRWDVAHSPSLGEADRRRLLTTLAHRLGAEGVLRVVAEDTRSQLGNRQLAAERLRALVAAALVPRRHRRPTAPTAASRARRLERKKHRGEVKRTRRPPEWG